MNAVVLDLEFCGIESKYKEQRKICKFETIQFGAVKLNHKHEIIDRFDMFVKPDFAHIDLTIENLTHISDEMVANACDFLTVLNEFLDWIGEQETTIYSWSMEDKRQLYRESKLKGCNDIRLERLFAQWVDLQKLIGDMLGLEQQISLSNALQGSGIPFKGQQHSAIDDAENTAMLFQLTQDEVKFKERLEPILDLFQPTDSLTFSLGSLFSDVVLQQFTSV